MVLNLSNIVEAAEPGHGNSLISGKKSLKAALDGRPNFRFLDWVYWRS
jgi:hypothetical protein